MDEKEEKQNMEIENIKVDPSAGSGQIQRDLENAKAKCEEYLSGWKRERADFLNYKKDEMERISQLAKYANEELILKIIPILDNIYLAEKYFTDVGRLQNLQDGRWIKGFVQIKNQLCDFFAKEGIELIKTLGEPFDPNTMEAVEELKSEDRHPMSIQSGTVVEEIQRGYTLHGKIIRVAKVRVTK